MNAYLVSCMSTKNSSLSYHSDHENMIDQNSNICTVSFGAASTLDFINKNSHHSGRKWTPPQTEFSVPATNHSMNVMKAGCQSFILHRIPPGKVGGVRYSLSFRRVLSQPANINPDPPSTSCKSPNGTTNVVSTPAQGKKKIVLLAGDSYFERLDMEKLGKGKQSVFKIAKGGRKIDAVLQSLNEFSADNPELDVTKLFICVGTNDIRNCHEGGVSHLKTLYKPFLTPLKNVSRMLKYINNRSCQYHLMEIDSRTGMF